MSALNHMYVRFWGVRGSIPVSNAHYIRYGGNTSCVEVRCGEAVFVFDAGSGIRGLGAALFEEGCTEVDLFLSHSHIDHILGLPFFPLAYQNGNTLRVWSGHQPADGSTEEAVRHLMSAPLFPVSPEIFSAHVAFFDFQAGETLNPKPGIVIHTAPLRHPDGATGYRVEYAGKSICYITDTEHEPGMQDENIIGLIEGADIVIYDAMFTDAEFPHYRGWGHSTFEEGARLCRASGVKTYVIFHHAPKRDDEALSRIEGAARRLFAGAVVAREGLTLSP